MCVCVRWPVRPCGLLRPLPLPLLLPLVLPSLPLQPPAPPPSRPSQHSDIIITRVWPLISNVNIFHIDECAVCPHCAQNGLQPGSGHESLLCHTHTQKRTHRQIHTKHVQSHATDMPVSTHILHTHKYITGAFLTLSHKYIFRFFTHTEGS